MRYSNHKMVLATLALCMLLLGAALNVVMAAPDIAATRPRGLLQVAAPGGGAQGAAPDGGAAGAAPGGGAAGAAPGGGAAGADPAGGAAGAAPGGGAAGAAPGGGAAGTAPGGGPQGAAPGGAAGTAPGGGAKSEYVDPQNKARAAVGVAPLTWNDTVAAYALDYSNQRANDCELIHSHGPYGENLAQASYDPTPAEVVKWWVDDEKPFFDYNSNKCVGGACGHYTQAVSNTSLTVGCAKVQCKNNKGYFVSCNYSPPGNYIGVKPY